MDDPPDRPPPPGAAPSDPTPSAEAGEPIAASTDPRQPEPDRSTASTPEDKAAAWGRPFARLDAAWTRFEVALCTGVLVAEILALCFWIAMKGLSTPSTGSSPAGIVFRAIFGATLLGFAALWTTRRKSLGAKRAATLVAIGLGLLVAPAWKNAGVDYFSNWLNWYQDGSTLTLVGGLRGVGTRLTMWLALLGASLATGAGKHINVDVVMRFLRPRARVPVAAIGWAMSGAVCLSGVWGFFDHIAIDSYGAKADLGAGAKIAHVAHHSGEHFFLFRRQVALDLRTLPRVLRAQRYDAYLTGAEWNAWIDEGGWGDHYAPDQVASIRVPVEAAASTHPPLVVVPGGTNRGLLAHDLNLIFPFGLLMIGLRFLLRCILAASGHARVDPEAAHGGDDHPRAPAEAGTAAAAPEASS